MTASSVKMAATISGSPFSQASIHCALPLSIARLASANVSGAASGPADGFLACEKTGWAAKRKMIVPRRNRFILESPFVRRTLYRRKGELVGHRTDNMSHSASILPYGRRGANIGQNGQPVIRCCYPRDYFRKRLEKIGPVYFKHGRRVQWNLLTEFKHLRLAFHALAFVSHAITWNTRQRSSQRLRNTSHFRPRI